MEEFREDFLTDAQCFSCGFIVASRFIFKKTLNGLILPLHLQVWAFLSLAPKVNIFPPVSVQFLLEFESEALTLKLSLSL